MEAFIGTVQLFAFSYAPAGWYACDGAVLPIAVNQALFALIGTTYGGDGVSTFALPDLRGKAPLDGLGYYLCANGIWPPRP